VSTRPVLKMGDRRLLQRAQPVRNFGTPQLERLVEDLWDTMAACQGAGLAAPQIGVPLQVVVFGVHGNPRYPQAEDVADTVLINPRLQAIGDAIESDWEGCLSLPGLRGLVPRHSRIRYTGFDVEGRAISREATGFHARVVQHECDHLNGVLFPMRMRSLRDFGFEDTLGGPHGLLASE
jgi:peptide deformylase